LYTYAANQQMHSDKMCCIIY